MGQYLSLRYSQVIVVTGYPVLTAVNLSTWMCNIRLHLGFQTSYSVRWMVGLLVYGHVITKFSRMDSFS